MADRKLVFKVSDVPMMELADGRFRDVFQITDQTCGPDTKLSAGVVWLSPHNDAGHMDTHDQDEAFYIISGTGTYIADGVAYPVEGGDTVYCPARTEHTFHTGDDILQLFWLIAGQWSTDLEKIKNEVEGPGWREVDGATGWHLDA
jgi:mannose-6-phosphate isomerase-like protein (cupin superfamily)